MTGHTRPRALRHWVSIAAGAACTLAAQAQQAPAGSSTPSGTGPSPYSIGVSENLSHESNLFRDDSNKTTDYISVTALNFGLDQMLGRQHLHGLASLQMNRYRYHDNLNNTGHDLGLALDWETINDLSGVLGVQSTRKQYQYGLDSGAPFGNSKNIESTESAYFQGKLGGMGQYELLAGANALHRDYSAAAFAGQEFSQWGAEAGGGWHPGPDLRSALVARYTRISRPDVTTLGTPPVILAGDDVSRKDIEASLGWQATGASRFDLRVARSQENHAMWPDKSFWSGSVAWDWAPSAKLHFTTKALRDTEGISGNIASAQATLPSTPAGDQLRDAFEWTAAWAATSKIYVTAAAQYSRRRLTGLDAGGLVLHAVDRTTGVSLGARYSPIRSLDLTCDVHNETRDTNTTDLTLTRPYDSLTLGCGLQLWLR